MQHGLHKQKGLLQPSESLIAAMTQVRRTCHRWLLSMSILRWNSFHRSHVGFHHPGHVVFITLVMWVFITLVMWVFITLVMRSLDTHAETMLLYHQVCPIPCQVLCCCDHLDVCLTELLK